MNQWIACCGLDCEKCDARIATINNDDALRQRTAALWSEMNHASITAEMIHCVGCRMDGVKTPYCESMCGIRKCTMEKGFGTCGECPQVESCEIVGAIRNNSPEAAQNLKSIK